ncbi:hypothetical protein ACH5RR_024308 [Cinchona calisaya]|uniref:Uncharacterized protein n=1 Tax=Cinchona calisaya TaxID=153742 RepID=A0ABD2YXB3_9GENT
MALSEQENYYGESDHTDGYDSDDSQKDSTFDILEETRSSFSSLSIKKKYNLGLDKEMIEDAEGEGDSDVIEEVVVPELGEKDKKSYEAVLKVIEDGKLEKLKVDQCKVYLRKHGLRLTGKKDTLIQRIREHLGILSGGGEKNYPASSFVVNCKGDACTGDIVLFEQNVYEMFNIASRSANGPPCGTRLIAGRIVKESYGAAKQQHTFTIEVLWSKGEKPLPPLHPLLIKGRNLYRLKTVRQKWEDEGERKKILSEKHARGCVARTNREARVQEREIRRKWKSDRLFKTEDTSEKQGENRKQGSSSLSIPLKNIIPPQRQPESMQTKQSQYVQPTECWESRTAAKPEGVEPVQTRPEFSLHVNVPLGRHHFPRQPFNSMNCNFARDSSRMSTYEDQSKFKNSLSSAHMLAYNGSHPLRVLPDDCETNTTNVLGSPTRIHAYGQSRSSLQNHFYRGNVNMNPSRDAKQINACVQDENFCASRNVVQRGPLHEKKQQCRHYAQGRCYYGQNCNYLH